MLLLNNVHRKHNISYKWKPAQDYTSSGSIIYPRGSLRPFKGKINTQISIVNKVFTEGIERDNSSFVIETVSQFPFRKDDIIIDDTGKEYIIINPYYVPDENQSMFLKTDAISKLWYLGVEGDE